MSDDKPADELLLRASTITEIRDRRVPTAAVRLVRWDHLSPALVFSKGFTPAVSKKPKDVTAVDLRNAKANRLSSPFVFTTNCFADRDRRAVTRWKPYAFETLARTAVLYEYEVYKAGGYDVDRSLPILDSHARKGDVAFAGPIDTAFIRSATEYDVSGDPVRYWINGSFDIGANGEDMPKILQIPPHVYPPSLPATVWTKGSDANQPADLASNVTDDAMFTFGGGQHPVFVGDAFSHPRPRACVPVPNKDDQYFFFTDTRVVQFSLQKKDGKFFTTTVGNGAVNISASWPSLNQAGFATVDAILDLGNVRARFFSGRNCIEATLQSSVSGKLTGGTISPSVIVVQSNSLRQIEFATVDAIWVPPKSIKETDSKDANDKLKSFDVYYFQGTQCAIVPTVTNITTNTVTDSVREGPVLISRRFKALAEAGFTTVDTFVRVPSTDEVFVFSGTDYLRATSDLATIKDGPVPISSAVWGALTSSGFY